MEIEYKIIVEMAKEIGDLRANLDSEYGEYHKENYKVKNIIFDVKKVILFDDTGFGACATIEVNKLEVK